MRWNREVRQNGINTIFFYQKWMERWGSQSLSSMFILYSSENGVILTTHFFSWSKDNVFFKENTHALFSKRSAHKNQHHCLRSLGHRSQPWVILIWSNGLESKSQKTQCQNLKEFSNGVFCILLSRPFDKLGMTQGRGQWSRVTRRTGRNQCALHLEKSLVAHSSP